MYQLLLTLLAVLSLAGCNSIQPSATTPSDDMKKGPGLLTGPTGYYEIGL